MSKMVGCGHRRWPGPPIPNTHPKIPKRRVSDGFGRCMQTWEAPTGIPSEKRENQCCVYYKAEVLEKVVAPVLQELYGKAHYVFQQDGAPAHTANIVQA